MHTLDIIKRISPKFRPTPHSQSFGSIIDESGAIIDKTMMVFHPGPGSYTGEDLAEISCHGNPLVVDRIMKAISATHLARMAQKGEFTRRAFLNGKMDLLQAEAVGALIGSTSTSGCTMAHALLTGELSCRIRSMREELLGLLADIEASFITEGELMNRAAVFQRLSETASQIAGLLKDTDQRKSIYDGVLTTIAGLPNVGKSSLFNALIGYDRAIVHPEEGTTRDVLREHLNLDGIDFVFHDTAGIRETSPGPERMGVEKTIEALRASNLVLYVVDAREGIREHEKQWLSLAERTIVVMNKTDLVQGPVQGIEGCDTVGVSAKYRLGLEDLMSAMKTAFNHDNPLVFMERHAYQLGRALSSIDSCLRTIRDGYTEDVLALDLSDAVKYLSQMTGEGVDDDILERVFSTFCIGK